LTREHLKSIVEITTHMIERETFSKRLKRLMEEKNLSQSEVASKTGIDRSELNRLVHGKRAPKAREAAWLIEALGVTEFMQGIDIAGDPAFREEIEQHQELARRMLDAERARDDAQAAHKSLEASFRSAETAWRTERQELQEALRDNRRDCAERLKQRDEALAKRENELLTKLSQANDYVAALERQLRATQQLAADRTAQLTQLSKALEAERAKVTSAGLFGGLVGALIGVGAGAAAASSDDEE
jgi:transcriptional regulator with XRE-family HTH domain